MRASARGSARTLGWGVVATVALELGAASLPAPAAAQEDFRAAELDRPIRVEDAHPIKFREWEFQSGLRGSLGEGDRGLLGLLEFKTGLFRNGQVGIEIEGGVERPSGDATGGGIEAASAHLLYGLARETDSHPAVAVRFDVSTPGAGPIGHDEWQFGLAGIATRSLGRLRVHGNGGYRIASGAHGGDYWRFGLGADYPIGLFSRAILADLYVEAPVSAGRKRVWAEIGTRLQVSNWSVLDLGLATRLDEWEEGNANVEIVVGVSRAFGIPGLTRVPPYPNPTIP